ncbi:hypothetical protein OF83DRAFT_1113399 [Amylostereum chailletii]|nr:hypothetical protein OF83DRAFT_1113399 [Amylostereum chailletii]
MHSTARIHIKAAWRDSYISCPPALSAPHQFSLPIRVSWRYYPLFTSYTTHPTQPCPSSSPPSSPSRLPPWCTRRWSPSRPSPSSPASGCSFPANAPSSRPASTSISRLSPIRTAAAPSTRPPECSRPPSTVRSWLKQGLSPHPWCAHTPTERPPKHTTTPARCARGSVRSAPSTTAATPTCLA